MAVFSCLCALVLVLGLFMYTKVVSVMSGAERRKTHLPRTLIRICGGIVLTTFFVEAVVES